MNKLMSVLAVAVLLLTTGCREEKKALTKGQVKDLWSQVSDKDFIRVRGIGVAPEASRGETRRKGLARNAALVSARYELLQIIKGLKVTGGLTIGQLSQTDGEIKEAADRIMAGAEEEQTEFTSDGGCVVLLRLDRSKVEDIVAKTADFEAAAR